MRRPSPRRAPRGFTLIELMTVVAIVGILVTIALPQLWDYTVRTKVSEAILAGSPCRTAISEGMQSAAASPAANGWGCEASAPSRYVASVATTSAGQVIITTSAAADLKEAASRTLTLTPYVDASTPFAASDVGKPIFRWVCGPGAGESAMPIKYLPSSCRGQ